MAPRMAHSCTQHHNRMHFGERSCAHAHSRAFLLLFETNRTKQLAIMPDDHVSTGLIRAA